MPKIFHTALICTNGHIKTSCLIENQHYLKNTYCVDCGSKLISSCPNCNEQINGCEEFYSDSSYYAVNTLYDKEYTLPKYCPHCRKPYPWMEAILNEMEEIIDQADELDEVDRAILKEKFPLLLIDVPGSTAAALKVSKILKNSSNVTFQAFKSAVFSKVAANALEIVFKTLS